MMKKLIILNRDMNHYKSKKYHRIVQKRRENRLRNYNLQNMKN